MTSKHRSQFEYDGENARIGPLRLTLDDIALVKKLNPELYTYLPAHWLHALIAPDKNYFRYAKRLGAISRWRIPAQPGGRAEPPYLQRHQVPLKHAVYSRTPAGDTIVNEPNPRRTKQPFAHQLLQDMVKASIELGARSVPGFELITWPQIRDLGWLESGEKQFVPDQTLDAPDPHLIRMPKGRVRPDEAPLLLKYRGFQLFLLGNEIDRGTEPLTTTHASRRNIKQKFEQYKELFQKSLYKSHYNFPNSLVLFVFTNQTRMNSAIELQAQVFDRRCPFIVHYHWRDWANERSLPKPNDYIFSAAGRRLGCPDFRLCEFWR